MIIWLNLFAFGGLEAAFLWVIILGLYWDKANAYGAISSIVISWAVIFLTAFSIKLWGFNAIVPALIFWITGIFSQELCWYRKNVTMPSLHSASLER